MNIRQYIIIILSRKNLIALFLSVTVVTTLVVSLILPKQFLAKTTLVIDQRSVDPITGTILPIQAMMIAGYMATQTEIISSHAVAVQVVDMLGLNEKEKFQSDFRKSGEDGDIRDWIADYLLKKLEVKPSRESSIIQIGFSSPDKNFSAQIANSFAKAYKQSIVDLNAQAAKQNADWLDAQLITLRQKVEDAQERLSDYQKQHGIVIADEKLDMENERLSEIAKQLVENQGRTYELVSRKKQLEEALAGRESLESMQEILSNGLIQSLKADLARAEGKFAELSERLDVNHPLYQQAQAEISSLKKRVQMEVKTVLNGIESSVAASKLRDESLMEALDIQKNRVLELKEHNYEFIVLNGEVSNAQRVYDAVMQRSVQVRMESEISQTNIAVLNPAIPPQKPHKPKLLLNMVLSIVLGGIFGIGAAFVAEALDRRVRSAFDITDNLGLPVLGVIVATRQEKSFRWPFMGIFGVK